MTREEALDFLYEYMPLPDSVDCSRQFFASNVDLSFEARKTMKWGSRVPEREFRHFVLPVRVNNENLDSSRAVFYSELAPRVEGLSMADAVLEVNHWCHEKVTYIPSDARTSSPLTTIRAARGRCGEESTLLVAALRSVCIPARQVYTPRWAHTDDNHAWVEAWVDGRWHFLGACEPEPVLDLGWFNAPASRALLMHTKVFGRYDGPENVMSTSDCYTEIDVTDGYAPTGTAVVKVVDAQGRPASGATVEFKIYNYAEFHTVTSRIADANGCVTMHSGLGDLVTWGRKDGCYGYAVCPVREADTVVVHLNRVAGQTYTDDLTIVPPVERANIPEVSAEARACNDRRLEREDSLRNATVASWEAELAACCGDASGCDSGLPAGCERFLTAARGNYPEILTFIQRARVTPDAAANAKYAAALLGTLAEKDLHDITCDILCDHLFNAVRRKGVSETDFVKYVLNPRVANEMIVPYRALLRDFSLIENGAGTSEAETSGTETSEAGANVETPEQIAEWVSANIRVDERRNPQHLRMSPIGVLRNRACDSYSMGIFLVALMRAKGIPARIDPVTDYVEYLSSEGIWVRFETLGAGAGLAQLSAEPSAAFSAQSAVQPSFGRLRLSYSPGSYIRDPKYYSHFTVSRIDNGRAVLLNYDENDSWTSTFKSGQTLQTGDYQVVSGTRLSDGSALVHIETAPVASGVTTRCPLILPVENEALSVIGSLNSEALFRRLTPAPNGTLAPASNGALVSILSATGRGYFVVGLLRPGAEPTVHALKDLEKCRHQLEKWGGKILLLTPDEASAAKLRLSDFPDLPSNTVWGVDATGLIEKELREGMNLRNSPVFVIADTFNRVVYTSEGYTIGMGEKLAAALAKTLPGYVPTKANLASRAEFAGMKLGIFIHWGIYSMFGQGEWYMQNAGIDWREYAKAARGFYPAHFDAREWVEAIKGSGARYITFTSRHHDSFSMFKTAESDFNIVDATPFGRDVVGELAEECHRQGVRLHLYYSHADWRREDYPWGRTGHNTGRDPSKQNWDSYLAFMKGQLTELLTNYGPIGAIWFDGVWDHREDPQPFDWCLDEQYELIHSLQPACLVGNNHHMNVNPGEDIQIFERDVPGENKAGYSGEMTISRLPLETCQTMNGMWGYKITDQNYKSVDDIVRLLVATAGKGANLLLNIGPQPSGELPAAALDRLRGLGEWTSRYGQSIYGTTAGPIRGSWGVSTLGSVSAEIHDGASKTGCVSSTSLDGASTSRETRALYLHILDKQLKTLTLSLAELADAGVPAALDLSALSSGDASSLRAYSLNSGNWLPVVCDGRNITITLPESDEVDRIIRL